MKVIAFVVAFAALGLAACNQQPAASTEKPAAVVNGTPISNELVALVAKSQFGKDVKDLTVQQRGDLLDTIVRAEVVAQQAVKDKLDQDPDTAAELAISRLQMLQAAAAEAYFKTHEVTDAELHAEYDEQIKAMPKLEYQARHVLVSTEAEANEIIKKLKAGASLASFAGKSLDTATKDKGGALGWVSASSGFVPEFTDALVKLKKGEFTTTPVKTQFGYHVISVDDTRATVPQPFDSVKDVLKQLVERKKFKAYGDELLKNATVVKNVE